MDRKIKMEITNRNSIGHSINTKNNEAEMDTNRSKSRSKQPLQQNDYTDQKSQRSNRQLKLALMPPKSGPNDSHEGSYRSKSPSAASPQGKGQRSKRNEAERSKTTMGDHRDQDQDSLALKQTKSGLAAKKSVEKIKTDFKNSKSSSNQASPGASHLNDHAKHDGEAEQHSSHPCAESQSRNDHSILSQPAYTQQ